MDNRQMYPSERFEVIEFDVKTTYWAEGRFIVVGFRCRDDMLAMEKHIERLLVSAKK